MELLSISAARSGQVLAQAVTNANGAVLCPPGFRLTESVIERLKNAGVESLLIEGNESQGPTPQERIATLQRRFSGVDDPILMQIEATIENRLKILAEERGASR
jgi:hypothetical protein